MKKKLLKIPVAARWKILSYIMQVLFILFASLHVVLLLGSIILGDGWAIFTAAVWSSTLGLMAWSEVRDRRLEAWRREHTIVLPPNWPSRDA